jgi:hypothetical protein
LPWRNECEKAGGQENIRSHTTAPPPETGLRYRNKLPFGEGVWLWALNFNSMSVAENDLTVKQNGRMLQSTRPFLDTLD